ncbi:MAG: DUF116 domain-containing protein, partial [Planctomycetes bacterium]|nr:DUF116 domain-containing protein [Planctomycetota bacterium]
MVRGMKPNDQRDADATRARLGSSNPDGGGAVNPSTGSPMSLPPKMPQQPFRPTQPGIPQQESVRERLACFARQHVERKSLVPPFTLDEIAEHAREVCRTAGVDPAYRNFVGVLVSNEAWRDVVAGIPYDRRLLLLPQCLRADGQCSAPIDEFGLVCQKCGSCLIHYLTVEAERLGYAVLVAEGATVVTKLLGTGQIEAVVGISCMSVLEKCFPHLEARAVPGLAIPLLQDGCANTSIDTALALEAIHLCQEDRTDRLDL